MPNSMQAPNQGAKSPVPAGNSNRWETKQLVTMALMCAIAALLSFVEFPIFPAAPFLKYDASFVPVMVTGFAYGVGPSLVVGVLTAVIHALVSGNWVGALMNIVMVCFYVIPAAIVYKRMHTFVGGVVALVVGCVCALIGCCIANLTIGVAFWYGSLDAILPLMIPAILPFNAMKAVLNSVLTMVVYKSISNLITPAKDQVKGR